MNWIKGQPTEIGKYHVIYKLFNHKDGKILVELHIITIDIINVENRKICFIPNTDIIISQKSIVAYIEVQKIPAEFYDEQ